MKKVLTVHWWTGVKCNRPEGKGPYIPEIHSWMGLYIPERDRLELEMEVSNMKLKFYRCEICGNIIGKVYDSGVDVECCGKYMTPLTANTSDGAVEKHVPVVTVDGSNVHVKIGSAEHPMTEEHFIEWIALQTKTGNQRKCLKPGDKPEVCFCICDGDEVEAVYAYCNLHGLWKN